MLPVEYMLPYPLEILKHRHPGNITYEEVIVREDWLRHVHITRILFFTVLGNDI